MAEKFGLSHFEGKQKVKGIRSGRSWEIDAKGLAKGQETFIIVECRRRSRRQNQEQIGGLAYRIIDTGAAGGIIVSPLGLQRGAEIVAQAENIHNVILDKNSTTANYILRFLDEVRVGHTEVLMVAVDVRVGPSVKSNEEDTSNG